MCHIEHRGRDHPLGTIDEAHCAGCHFRSFASHPEFEILRTSSPDAEREPELTGLATFSHFDHFDAIQRKRDIDRDASCFECHEYDGSDFAPLTFERSCKTCHDLEGIDDYINVAVVGESPPGPDQIARAILEGGELSVVREIDDVLVDLVLPESTYSAEPADRP